MGMFGCDEVAIISRFDDELKDHADIDHVEAFVKLNGVSQKTEYIRQFQLVGDNILTFLFLKSLLFRELNGFEWKDQVREIGVEVDNVIPLGTSSKRRSLRP
jgi:hypothetical protein